MRGPTGRASRASAIALASVLACFGAGGCKKAPRPAVETGSTPVAGLTPEQASQVLARVGGRTITLGDYASAIEHMDRFDRMRYRSPERRKDLLHEMIDVMLLADEARDKGYDKDPVTQQQMREILRDAYFARARQGAPLPNDLPEADVRAYYDAHRSDFRDPERRRISAIVLPTEQAARAALGAAKGATAVQWGEMVRAKSIDAQAKADVPVDLAGDQGFVDPPGQGRGGSSTRVPEEVRKAAFDIAAVGDVLPRVVAAGGRFYVLRLTSRTDPHERTLQDAERTIRVKLTQDQMQAKEEAALDELRKRYPVTIDEAALSQVRVDLPAGQAGVGAPAPGSSR